MNQVFAFAASLNEQVKWHGNHTENDSQKLLNAGCLSMFYENGNLRYISAGKEEIIRMIYSAVRIKNWITIAPEIISEETEIHPDSFNIKYKCLYKSGEIRFSAEYIIEGKNDNSLTFILKGEAFTSFEKNRIGFCVLHPVMNNAAKDCIIEHSDGSLETSVFPFSISPHQPFSDIKSMKWKVSDYNVSIAFNGDVFETEDHRNWTDASYKTYCTPLKQLYPVRIEKGEKIFQKIELKVEGNLRNENSGKLDEQIYISADIRKSYTMPSIGIGRSTRLFSLSDNEIETLKKIQFEHYRIDLYLFHNDWKSKAELAADEALRLEYPIELALFFDENYNDQASDFISWISNSHMTFKRITIFHKNQSSTPSFLSEMIIPLFKDALPGIKTGAGTNANFAQLNRNRPDPLLLDYLSYSIHPQEHANDTITLTENLEAQMYTVESAGKFSGGKGIWVSPVNIMRRFNANSENYENTYEKAGCPPQVDSRLMSLYGACWTTGSLKYLIESGAEGMTYYETTGERGIIQGEYPSRWPVEFKSVAGMIFPVYFVFRFLLKYKSFKILKSESSAPLKAASLILTDGNEIKFIITNFTSSVQRVKIHNLSGLSCLKIRQLDADSFAAAVSDDSWLEDTRQTKLEQLQPLILNPFSVNFIDACIKL
jgi:D-apionolactonase